MARVNSGALAFNMCDLSLLVRKNSLPGREDTVYPQSCSHLYSSAFLCQVLPLYHFPLIGSELVFALRSQKMGDKWMYWCLVAQAARG